MFASTGLGAQFSIIKLDGFTFDALVGANYINISDNSAYSKNIVTPKYGLALNFYPNKWNSSGNRGVYYNNFWFPNSTGVEVTARLLEIVVRSLILVAR